MKPRRRRLPAALQRLLRFPFGSAKRRQQVRLVDRCFLTFSLRRIATLDLSDASSAVGIADGYRNSVYVAANNFSKTLRARRDRRKKWIVDPSDQRKVQRPSMLLSSV
eukprot:scaffold735_cov255-Pinguiococcus_pyrenoidosus.AAC.15